MATSTTVLQKAVNSLSGKHLQEKMPTKVRGSRAVFNKTLFGFVSSRKSIADLDFAPSTKMAGKVRTTLKDWADGKTFFVLMSEHLPVHLGLPVRTYPQDCWLFQVLLLGKDLPFLLLTLYDGESVDVKPTRAQVEDFTTRCARMLTFLLLDFCLKDFVLFPCTVEIESFNVERLEKEVNVQRRRVADFYSGPFKPRAEAFQRLDRALSIVASSSEVPYFLEDGKDAGEKLVVADPEMDEALRRFIAHLLQSESPSCPPQTIRYWEETRWARTVLLEAALRLSYRQKVVVITDDEQVLTCVRRLADCAGREYGLDSSWFRSVPVHEILDELRCTNTGQPVHTWTPSDPSISHDMKSTENIPKRAFPSTSSSGDAESRNLTPNQAERADCYIVIDAPNVPDFPGLRLKLLKHGRFPAPSTDVSRDKRKIRILLMGKSGSGKSATGNSLMGGVKRFNADVSFSPVTTAGQSAMREYGDVTIEVVETPGIYSLTETFNGACSPYSDASGKDVNQTFDVVCFVVKIARFTEEDSHVFQRIQQMFGSTVVKRMVAIFTGGDCLKAGENVDAMLANATGVLRRVISQCEDRYVVFDNTRPQNTDQVNEFLRVVKRMKAGETFECPSYAELSSRWETARSEDMKEKKRKLHAG